MLVKSKGHHKKAIYNTFFFFLRIRIKLLTSYETFSIIYNGKRLQEAIENESFYDGRCVYWQKGCVDRGLDESYRSVNGTLRIGGQDHFYLETHCCLAIPLNENDEIEVISSTQSPNDLQVIIPGAERTCGR